MVEQICPIDWRDIFMKQSVDKYRQINFGNFCNSHVAFSLSGATDQHKVLKHLKSLILVNSELFPWRTDLICCFLCAYVMAASCPRPLSEQYSAVCCWVKTIFAKLNLLRPTSNPSPFTPLVITWSFDDKSLHQVLLFSNVYTFMQKLEAESVRNKLYSFYIQTSLENEVMPYLEHQKCSDRRNLSKQAAVKGWASLWQNAYSAVLSNPRASNSNNKVCLNQNSSFVLMSSIPSVLLLLLSVITASYR